MTKKVRHKDESSSGGSNIVAVCPFCGTKCDANNTKSYCNHFVEWAGETYHEYAKFTDGVNETRD